MQAERIDAAGRPRARRLIRVAEAAERLDCHPALVYRLIEKGELPALQLGGRGCSIRIDEDEFDAWLFEQGEGAA